MVILRYRKQNVHISILGINYLALDGCTTNEIDDFKDTSPGYYDGNDKIAQIVCCTMDGSSCSRTIGTGQCRSGDGKRKEQQKVTWSTANEHCKADGKRLCSSQKELNQCCSSGCNHDNHLVWINAQQSGKFAKNHFVYTIIFRIITSYKIVNVLMYKHPIFCSCRYYQSCLRKWDHKIWPTLQPVQIINICCSKCFV